MKNMVTKLNPDSLKFMTLYYKTCRKLRIPSARTQGLRGEHERAPLCKESFIFSLLASYSTSGENGKKCSIRYADLQYIFGTGSATVTRNIQNLCDSDLIEQDRSDPKNTAYKIKVPVDRQHYIMIDTEVLKQGGIRIDGIFYHLAPAAIKVFYHILTNALDESTDGVFRGCRNKIANTIGISPSCAGKSIQRLIEIKAITRQKTAKNSAEESEYKIPDELLAIERRKRETWDSDRRAREARRLSKMSEQQREIYSADKRAARERVFSLRRAKNQQHADFYNRKLDRDAQYLKIQKRIRELDIEIAKAEARRTPDLDELRKEYARLIKKRDKRLSQLKITLDMLKPEYFCKCKKCSDTGFLPSGRMCACDNPPRGKP